MTEKAMTEKAMTEKAMTETAMTWETPIVIEVAVGLEVTSYASGEDDDIRP